MLSLLAAYMPPLRIAFEGAAAPSIIPGAYLPRQSAGNMDSD